ncbi:MAG: HAD-superfamily hydrolase, subfamily [Rhizobium sp.]|nr:HAD-superfamily hydrolase, subfamily [Rhizobium sp.]
MSVVTNSLPPGFPDLAGVISDLDGVVYRGAEPIAEAVEVFRHWHKAGLPYRFVTNNSTKSAEEFASKLRDFGVPAQASDVVTSAQATAELLKARWPEGARVFVMGASSLMEAVAAAGFEISDQKADIVVVGLDRTVTYAKLKTAVRFVLNGAPLIGTNPDLLLPCEDGFEPGAGMLLTAISAASGKAPTVVGKPEPHMIETALARLGTERTRTIMIGDQLDTDIQAGRRAGLFSVLVQTGVPASSRSEIQADLTIASLSELVA